MPDTGPPWNLRFPDVTDLVVDGPEQFENLAEDVAAGLSAAGGLVAVKSAIFTGTQTNSTAPGANFAVTNLTITHEVADPANKLIISAFFGIVANSGGRGDVGLGIMENSTFIGVGDAVGSRTRVGAGQVEGGDRSNFVTHSNALTFVHTPGAGEKTYTVRAINIRRGTETVYINRSQADTSDVNFPRGASGFVIQEVKV